MRSILLSALAVTFGASIALAADQAAAPAAAPAKPAQCNQAKGKKAAKPKVSVCKGAVEAVDAATGNLSVKDAAGAVKAFTLGADVKIKRNGKKAALADIAVGDSATVKFCGPADKPEVKSVAVKTPRKPKAAAATKDAATK